MKDGTGPGYTVTIPSISDREIYSRWALSEAHAPLIAKLNKLTDSASARPVLPSASDYLAARRTNDRGRIDRVWQGMRDVLGALAFRRCLLGIDANDPDDRLLDWTWEFLNQPTWVVSAHLPRFDLPLAGTAQLDLAACEMAMFMAEMREALLPWMNSVSSTLADSIVVEIEGRVLVPFGDGQAVHWAGEQSRLSNWAGVCAGSILAACLSLEAQGRPHPKCKARALQCLQAYFERAFTTHGECDEGLGYWTYGISYACAGLSRLERSQLEQSIDLDRMAQLADYPRRAHLFADTFFSGNDAGSRCAASVQALVWLAGLTGNEFLLRWCRAHPHYGVRDFPSIVRCAIALQQVGPLNDPALPSRKNASADLLEDQQVGIFCFDSNDHRLIVCLSGGNNDELHNHNDLGHFVVSVDEQVVIPDLGAPVYHADFFGPKRYEYLSASSRGHCCPLINGQAQIPGGAARATLLQWDATIGRLELDITSAYPPAARLKKWLRRAQREDQSLAILDSFEIDPAGEVCHVIWATSQPEPSTAGLLLGDLLIEFSPKPEKIEIEAVDAQSQFLREWAGKTLYRIEARYRADDRGSLQIRTTLSGQ